MGNEQNYTFGKSRLSRAFLSGFSVIGDRGLEPAGREGHFLVLPVLDSGRNGYRWGRLCLKAQISEGCRLIIRAFARDNGITGKGISWINGMLWDRHVPDSEKIAFFLQEEGIEAIGQEDILLLKLQGRYLWISIEIRNGARGKIEDIRVYNPADNFMQTFPEVYREEGGFFHRYMSIFSSIYAGVQEEIDNAYQYLDPATAPKEMLPVLAGWMGIHIEKDFLEESVFRELLQEAHELNRKKGTRWAIRRLTQILLGQEADITERNLLQTNEWDKELINSLYGSSRWDVTIMLEKEPKKDIREKYLYIVSQFKPVRCRIRLVFCQNCGDRMDSHCFLDRNARLAAISYGAMDAGNVMDGSAVLK